MRKGDAADRGALIDEELLGVGQLETSACEGDSTRSGAFDSTSNRPGSGAPRRGAPTLRVSRRCGAFVGAA